MFGTIMHVIIAEIVMLKGKKSVFFPFRHKMTVVRKGKTIYLCKCNMCQSSYKWRSLQIYK